MLLIPALYKSFACSFNVYTYFLPYLLFSYLPASLRIDLFRFQAGGRKRGRNLALVLDLCSFCVVVYFVKDACLLLLCSI